VATFIKNHWRSELVFLFSMVLSISLLWMENRAEPGIEANTVKGYGGSLPVEVQSIFQGITGDLAEANNIETAKPRRISIVDKAGTKRIYWFNHETVWRDGDPVISHVRSFHFEYRDQWGNLLTQSDRDPGSIESVGVAIRIATRGREIAAAVKVRLNQKSDSPPNEFAAVLGTR
jgi:hypothetical protein